MQCVMAGKQRTKPWVRGRTDGELLSTFLAGHDETAWAALIQRYKSRVLAICWSVLHQKEDVEDAFVLIRETLVRNAESLLDREIIEGWLVRTAYNVAKNVRRNRARWRRHECQIGESGIAEIAEIANPTIPAERHELRSILKMELGRLPEKYRLVLTLCDWEGMSRTQAAQQLGWPEGTVAKRLAKARQLMRAGLRRHGIVSADG